MKPSWIATAAVVACAACSGGAAVDPTLQRPLVELFSWWTAPGEAEALEALVVTHARIHPEARIFNAAAASGTMARERLNERLERGEPPDLFQEYVHDLRAELNPAAGKRAYLDDMFDELGLRAALFPEVLREVTSGDHIVAMPVNLHRENTLIYNRRIFAAHHLAPPQTLDELLADCRTLRKAGVVPIATAAQGWILRIMFNALAAAKMGSAAYRDYFSGESGAAGLPALRDAVGVFADVFESYTNPDATEEGFNWTSAAQAVYNGDAARFLHGDWVKGYLVQLGWQPDVDFGVVGAPGASDLFLYGIDVFALPVGATNQRGARDFLATVASTVGQAAFNRVKGSSPIRRDVPLDELDSVGRATLHDLERARIRMLVRSRPVWEDALAEFARDHNRDKLLQVFIDAPPGP